MSSQKKTFLITGATAGIGRHAAFHLAGRGHRVIATGRDIERLDEMGDQARAKGIDLRVVALDVTDAASIEAARERVDAITGGEGIDVLVNNAGYGTAGPLTETSDEDLRAQYDVNVFGLMAVTRAFVRPMMARGEGRVINVGSLGGRMTFPFFGAYSSTKYAVESISDALRIELRPFGVLVSLIEPGPIKSEFADRTMKELARHRGPDSPYREVLARADKVRTMTDRQSAGPMRVTRAIERAATVRRPRARYAVPLGARLFFSFARLLPQRLLDYGMARMVGLSSRTVSAPKREERVLQTV